jgi:hypothetical protein
VPLPPWLRRFAAIALAALLAHGTWVFALKSSGILRSPWSRDYGEGCTLAMAQLLAARGNYFPDLTDYPFLVSNYPPVYVALVALGQVVLGPSLLFPRLLALLSLLGLLAVLFVTLRRLLVAWGPAVALTLIFVMPWFVTTWAALARVDATAILLSLAGLAIVLHRGPVAKAWPALPLFWLAFFTKQNALVAPAAVLLHLGLGRDRRLFARALLGYALPLVALFGLLVLATRGGAWNHLVLYTAAAPYEWGRLGESYGRMAVVAAPLLALVAGGLLAAPAAFREGPGRILLLYFGLNALAFATIAKGGAAQNYFWEPWLATVLLAAWALRSLRERAAWVRTLWPALLAVAAAVASYAYPSLQRLPHALRRPENAEEFVALTRLVHEARGPVLSENLSVLVLDRRPVLLEPFGIQLIAERGLFDTGRLVRDCESSRFALVVTERRMEEVPGLGDCLERSYEPAADLGPYRALRPRANRSRP